MTSITQTEKQLYGQVWNDLDNYGDVSPGARLVPLFMAMTKSMSGATVLDAACGSGKGAVELVKAGFVVEMCDITDEGLIEEAQTFPFTKQCLWNPIDTAVDYVYCCDVMEHIPTEFTMLVIWQLLKVTRRGVFLAISLVPDRFGVWVGEPLHKTVRDFVWWRDRLGEIGHVVDARDLGMSGLYYLEAR